MRNFRDSKPPKMDAVIPISYLCAKKMHDRAFFWHVWAVTYAPGLRSHAPHAPTPCSRVTSFLSSPTIRLFTLYTLSLLWLKVAATSSTGHRLIAQASKI